MPIERRHDILEQVEEAYTKLIDFFEKNDSDPEDKEKPSFVLDEEPWYFKGFYI